jgi:hypothetical protein
VKQLRAVALALIATTLLVGGAAWQHRTPGGDSRPCAFCVQLERVTSTLPAPADLVREVRYSLDVVIAGVELMLSISIQHPGPARS